MSQKKSRFTEERNQAKKIVKEIKRKIKQLSRMESMSILYCDKLFLSVSLHLIEQTLKVWVDNSRILRTLNPKKEDTDEHI
ncbi:MAG: hypothetical protein GY861_24260 [bacterium]|nr:hypothetical protein [bacterium]